MYNKLVGRKWTSLANSMQYQVQIRHVAIVRDTAFGVMIKNVLPI